MIKSKRITLSILTFLFSSLLFCQEFCEKTITDSMQMDTADQVLEFLSKQIPLSKSAFDKRVLYCFSAGIQEQTGLYQQASKSYALAAGQSLTTAQINEFKIPVNPKPAQLIIYNYLKKTSSLLVLDAVRCSLNTGDYVTARKYLDSSIKKSQDPKICSYIKLYEVWSNLCAASGDAELEQVIVQLKAFCAMEELEPVRPQLLFTLWYVTADNKIADTLKKKYPSSLETGFVNGNVQIMPTPFWFFVPRKGNSIAEISDAKANQSSNLKAANIEVAVKENDKTEKKEVEKTQTSGKVKKLQLGLFGQKENARELCERVNSKGFNAYIEQEKRPSGTVYFIVVVDENEQGTCGSLLKTAGFECYPIFKD